MAMLLPVWIFLVAVMLTLTASVLLQTTSLSRQKSRAAEPTDSPNKPQLNLVVLGDSISTADPQGYAKQLATELSTKYDVLLINKAVGGSTTSGLLS